MYLFPFLWHEILVLIFNNMFIYMLRLVVQFVEMHCTRTHQIFIDLHPGNDCVLFIELFTNRHVSAIKKNNYSIFIPIVAIWLWGLRNNNLFYNFLQFLTFVLYILLQVGPLGKLAEAYFFLLKTTNMSYYNCGIRPKHSNISKKGGGGVLQLGWYYLDQK